MYYSLGLTHIFWLWNKIYSQTFLWLCDLKGVTSMKKSNKKTNLGKKAIMSALALSVGAAASASAVDKALGDPLFSLKEIGSQTLIAHEEGKCGEGKCGEGKCGEGKCGEGKASAKARESKCGLSKIKSLFKKAGGKKAAKTTESKAGEGKCGEGKCGEGKCGSKK